jgi:drug/metabolite transporter (DMT)-like permease
MLGETWEKYALFALLLFTIPAIIQKHLFNLKCKFYDVIFMYIFFVIIAYSIILLVLYNYKKKVLFKDKKKFKLITYMSLFAAFLMCLGVVCKIKAYELVNNISYVHVLMDPPKIILLYLFSILIFGTIFKPITLLGIILAVTGILIVLKNQV